MTNRPCIVPRQVIKVGPLQVRAVIAKIYEHAASPAHCQVYYKWQGKELYEDVSWNWNGKIWEFRGGAGYAEGPQWQPYREILLGPPLAKLPTESRMARSPKRRRHK